MRSPRVPAAAPLAVLVALAATMPAPAQQVADSAFHPDLGPATWASGAGPHVAIDGAHHDFHTVDGRYRSFADLLRRDGYRVDGLDRTFTAASLADVDLLVVANALAARTQATDEWVRPTPSAFTADEIDAVRTWVEAGGSLLLIADHMPFPGAARDLASAFGFQLRNGFAFEGDDQGPLVFRRSDGSLARHTITDGRGSGTRVDSVATFTGEAFRAPADASSLLTFRVGTRSLEPDTAWTFHDDTPSVDVSGWSQGSVLRVGRGRVAVFGEAAMFSAQLAGPQRLPMGMNAPVAAQNPRFILNLVHWLTGA